MRKSLYAIGLALSVLVAPDFALANSLTVSNITASGTSTSVTYVISITGTNLAADLVTNVTSYFGSSDGLQVPANWGISVVSNAANMIATAGTNMTNTVFGLVADRTYYYSVSADSGSGTVWATSSAQIVTPRGGFAGAGSAAANALLPTGANVTNVAWSSALTNLATGSSAASSTIVAQVNAIIAGLGPQISNLVSQVSAINSNEHKTGSMP